MNTGITTYADITSKDWAEAADVLDTAHDVLLHTGVQCGETYTKGDFVSGGHNAYAVENCTWEAIAIALDEYTTESTPAWHSVASKCMLFDGMQDGDRSGTPVHAAIGDAMAGWAPDNNDRATVDEVFDRIREGAKYARERASGTDS